MPRKEGMLWIFFARKIRRLRPGSNPRSWVPEASMLTTRPPQPLSTALCSGKSLTCTRPFQISLIWNTYRIQAPNNLPPFTERNWTACCRALIRREGRRHASLATFSARLLSSNSTWPREVKRSPEALIAAGFFYVGNYLLYLLQTTEASVPLLRFIYYNCLQVGRQQTGRFVSIAVVVSRTG